MHYLRDGCIGLAIASRSENRKVINAQNILPKLFLFSEVLNGVEENSLLRVMMTPFLTPFLDIARFDYSFCSKEQYATWFVPYEFYYVLTITCISTCAVQHF